MSTKEEAMLTRIAATCPGIIGFDATPLEVERQTGVSRYSAQLLAALVARRDERRYALFASRRLRGAILRGTLGHVGPTLPNRWLWMQLVLPATLARLRPELCHFTNSTAPLLAPCPFVLTLHDMSLFLHPNTQPLKSRVLIRSLIPAVGRRAAAVITVSESARRDILAVLGLRPDRVHVVYEAASPAFRVIDDRSELDRVARRYGLKHPFILTVGTLEPRKNLPRLFEAFARVCRARRDVELVVAGPWGWRTQGLRAQVDRLRLTDSVRFLDYIPDGELPTLYTLARASAFPSLYEGFGLPIVESMACGTPVVTSNRSAMPEVADGAAILVDPTSVASIADGLLTILSDETRHAALREAGLRRAAQFSWRTVAQRTVEVYEMVMARQTAAG